jgi:hypothetical protein
VQRLVALVVVAVGQGPRGVVGYLHARVLVRRTGKRIHGHWRGVVGYLRRFALDIHTADGVGNRMETPLLGQQRLKRFVVDHDQLLGRPVVKVYDTKTPRELPELVAIFDAQYPESETAAMFFAYYMNACHDWLTGAWNVKFMIWFLGWALIVNAATANPATTPAGHIAWAAVMFCWAIIGAVNGCVWLYRQASSLKGAGMRRSGKEVNSVQDKATPEE